MVSECFLSLANAFSDICFVETNIFFQQMLLTPRGQTAEITIGPKMARFRPPSPGGKNNDHKKKMAKKAKYSSFSLTSILEACYALSETTL